MLDNKSLYQLAMCGHKWNRLASDNFLWKNRILAAYGHSLPILEKDLNHCKNYYQWLITSQMITLTDFSERSNCRYRDLFAKFLVIEKNCKRDDYTNFFYEFSVSNQQMNKKEMIIHVAILLLASGNDMKSLQAYHVVCDNPDGKRFIDHMNSTTQYQEISVLLAVSSLTYDQLHKLTFVE